MTRGYLVDTSVLSLFAPGRPPPTDALAAWLRRHDGALHISAVTVAEIEQGVCKLRRAGGSERAQTLSAWLDTLVASFADRILAFDAVAARLAGRMSDAATATGRNPGFADVAIAATAAVNQLVVLTGNGRHFAPLGVEWLDPDRIDAEPG